MNLPMAFHINSLLDIRKSLSIHVSQRVNESREKCPKHNDIFKVYCETCQEVICRDCTISKEHNTHDYHLISECYPKHHQQLQDSLDLVKHKLADIDTAVTCLATREKEVLQQGEQVKEEIDTHAQKMIDQIQRSRKDLKGKVEKLMHQKSCVLTAQKQEAEKLRTKLQMCEEMIESSLNDWSEQQILLEKQTLLNQMETATRNVEVDHFQPMEKLDLEFTNITTADVLGFVTGTAFSATTLKASSCHLDQPSIALLTLQSQDGTPFPLPPSLISSTLSSPGVDKPPVKCDITHANPGAYSITFIPSTRHDQLVVQVGGVDIPDSPFTLPVITFGGMRGTPVKVITGLNAPRGIAVCDNGDIVVAEKGTNSVTILNKKGEKIKSIAGTKGTKVSQFDHPHGIATSIDGHIFVTDRNVLHKLTSDGIFIKSTVFEGKQLAECPNGITAHPNGRIFATDCFNNRIQVFTNDLTFSHNIEINDSKKYKPFNRPCDIAIDKNGYLYVAELKSNCITKLAVRGKCITRFGSTGSGPGQLLSPSALVVSGNLVYVADVGNKRVSVFDTDGKFLNCFGEGFCNVYGIAVDRLGNLYISDTTSNRIVVC